MRGLCHVDNDDSMKFEISRSEAGKTKGVAIVMMIAYHTMGNSGKTLGINHNIIANRWLHQFFFTMSICVPMYLFLSGYGLMASGELGLRSSFRRVVRTVLRYWYYMVPFLVLGFCFGVPVFLHEMHAKDILTDFVCYTHIAVDPGWYMQPYIFSVLALPFLAKWVGRYPLVMTLLTMLSSLLIKLCVGLGVFYLPWDLFFWLSPFVLGMAFFCVLKSESGFQIVRYCSVVAGAGIFGACISHDVYYKIWFGPLLVLVVNSMLSRFPDFVGVCFSWLGRRSFSMWIIHSFFCWGLYRGIVGGIWGVTVIFFLTLTSAALVGWLMDFIVDGTHLKRIL